MAERLPKGDSPDPDDKSEDTDYYDYRPSYFGAPVTGKRKGWLQSRRDKTVAEIERNRSGDYKVPTWVLGAILAAIVIFWAVILILN